jgi:hypothetical protein
MSSTVTIAVGIPALGLSSSLSSTANIIVIGGRPCSCPPWQNIYEWSCGWIRDQQSCVTVQQLPFPFTIPVFRFYDLALSISSSGMSWTYNTTLMPLYNVSATLVTTYTYSYPGTTLYNYSGTPIYLFDTDGTLVNSWKPSPPIVTSYVNGQSLHLVYAQPPTVGNTFKNDQTLVLQWYRRNCD